MILNTGPERGTSSIDWAQLSRLLPDDGDRVVPEAFLNKKQDDE
jgi:hypothetical protein